MNLIYGVIVVTAAIYDIYMYVMQNPYFLALWEIKQKVEGKVFFGKMVIQFEWNEEKCSLIITISKNKRISNYIHMF